MDPNGVIEKLRPRMTPRLQKNLHGFGSCGKLVEVEVASGFNWFNHVQPTGTVTIAVTVSPSNQPTHWHRTSLQHRQAPRSRWQGGKWAPEVFESVATSGNQQSLVGSTWFNLVKKKHRSPSKSPRGHQGSHQCTELKNAVEQFLDCIIGDDEWICTRFGGPTKQKSCPS